MVINNLKEAEELINKRKAVKELNKTLQQEPGAQNKETVLVLISAEDHNGALAIDRKMKENMQRLAQGYNVHCVLVERSLDVKKQVKQLKGCGKAIGHLVVIAHGGVEKGVCLAGKCVSEYVQNEFKGEKIKRCLFFSCLSAAQNVLVHSISGSKSTRLRQQLIQI